LGASGVLAVDRNPMPNLNDPRVIYWQGMFHDLKLAAKVVLASWIINWDVGVEPIFDQAEIVLSLSKNTDGICCGYPAMWEYLRTREVLAYLPERANTLTIYGPARVSRNLTGEETAALDLSRIYSFENICEFENG
jgi:hypothetical protein